MLGIRRSDGRSVVAAEWSLTRSDCRFVDLLAAVVVGTVAARRHHLRGRPPGGAVGGTAADLARPLPPADHAAVMASHLGLGPHQNRRGCPTPTWRWRCSSNSQRRRRSAQLVAGDPITRRRSSGLVVELERRYPRRQRPPPGRRCRRPGRRRLSEVFPVVHQAIAVLVDAGDAQRLRQDEVVVQNTPSSSRRRSRCPWTRSRCWRG